MAVDRKYVLNKVMGKMMSPAEFNFDALMGPPLYSLLSTDDVMRLNNVATSIRYSANTPKKLSAIDEILRKRGFVKYTGGTNRVVYRFLENEDFILKIATNAVAIGDSPREMINQNIYKPFVTKVFEVSPCGTVGLFERVTPITSREEFLSIADDIFYLVSNWFTGQYVMDDIGSDYFLNYGLRSNRICKFGPVLLDFPYSYKLDGNKLYCNVPNVNDPTQKCGGVIDYDDGYNHLRCTKCGLIYRAKELEKAVNNNNVMIKGGSFDMVVKITSSKGVQRIENNPERYLDVSPKLVPRGKKKSPTKIGNEPKFKITGLRTPKPEPQEEIKEEIKVETPVEKEQDIISEFILCEGTVSNTRDLFDAEESIKCILVEDKNGDPVTINGDYLVIDSIQEREVKNLSIVSKESLDQLTENLENAKSSILSKTRRIEDLEKNLEEMTEELRDSNNHCEYLQSEINKVEKENSDYRENQELIDSCKKLEEEHHELKSKYDALLDELSEEQHAHNTTKSELAVMKILVDTLQKQLDDLAVSCEHNTEMEIITKESVITVGSSNSTVEEPVTFDVTSPLFTPEPEETIEDLKNDIEDKSIVEVVDKALPDGEDALLTNDAQEESVSSEEESEVAVVEADNIPVGVIPNQVTDNSNEFAEELGKTVEELKEEVNEDTPIVTVSYSNNSAEKVEESVHLTHGIVIPDNVKEQIANAGKIVSNENKSNNQKGNNNNHKNNNKENNKRIKKERPRYYRGKEDN